MFSCEFIARFNTDLMLCVEQLITWKKPSVSAASTICLATSLWCGPSSWERSIGCEASHVRAFCVAIRSDRGWMNGCGTQERPESIRPFTPLPCLTTKLNNVVWSSKLIAIICSLHFCLKTECWVVLTRGRRIYSIVTKIEI